MVLPNWNSPGATRSTRAAVEAILGTLAGSAQGLPLTVAGPSTVVDVTLALDAGHVYASGDVLAINAAVAGVFRTAGGTALLDSVRVLDEDKQAGAFDVLFFDSEVDVGAINAAYDMTDAEARSLLGWIRIAATDYETWTNFSTAMVRRGDPGMKAGLLKGAADNDQLYIAAISRDAKTYSASGIRLKMAFIDRS